MWSLVACTCAIPAIQVLPSATETAPRNAHIRLIAPETLDGVELELRPVLPETKRKKKAPPSKPVDLERRDAHAGALWLVELVPREPLAAATRYQLSMTRPEGRPAVIGELTTGDALDETPPAWKGVTKASWVKPSASPGMCQTGEPHVFLTHQPAPDTAVYAVWVGPERAKLDYARPPSTWVLDWNGRLPLGHPSICSPSNLDLPASGRLRIGVRAIDQAGNASPPSETTVTRAR